MEDLLDRLRTSLADRYVIKHEIGAGGMATVYLADDVRHGRQVALKLLKPELGAVLGGERFFREIQIAASLSHPHILPLHDSGEADGLLYYVMPYVQGESLRERLERHTQLSIEEAIETTRQVAAALDYAHRQGVVHRDIKPENILLQEGEAVVADFGIARALRVAGGERLTETGLSLGTPHYMSPEQASGALEVDSRSDVYALGCVLYEMLAGDPPFTGPTGPAVIARQLVDPVPSLRTVRATVPEELERAIEKALAKTPADRYDTAGAFVEAAGAAAEIQVVPTRERRALDRHHRKRKLLRSLVPAVAGAVVAVAAVAAWLLWPRVPALDPTLIAVAPFDVSGVEEELWQEAITTRLVHRLDGAGTLRGVAPAVVSESWDGRADPSSAAALASQVGAGLVIFGSVGRASGDSVRVAATLFDAITGRALQAHELEGPADPTELSDSLAVQVLTALAQNRVIGAVRMSSLGSTHPLAIKEFLTGEVHYRRWSLDSARAHFLRALEYDSNFALAHRRMAKAGGGIQHLRRAITLNRGLAARESVLLAADSLWLGAWGGVWEATRVGSVEDSLHQRLRETLAAARQAFPQDPEVWHELGKRLGQYGYEFWRMPIRPEDVRNALANAVWIDSGYMPAYPKLIEFELHLGGEGVAQRTIEAYLARADTGDSWEAYNLIRELLQAREQGEQRLDSLFAQRSGVTARDDVVGIATRLLEWGRVDVGTSLTRRPELSFLFPPAMLVYFGYLRESNDQLGDPDEWPDRDFAMAITYSWLAWAGTVPKEAAAAVFDGWLTEAWESRVALALPFWLKHQDTVSLRRAVELMDAIDDAGMNRLAEQGARGFLLLALGDTVAALEELEAYHLCVRDPLCREHSLVLAEVYEARGELREAEVLYSWVAYAGYPHFKGHAEFALGRINEQLGDVEKARWAYGAVIDRWSNADPELQPYVEEARAGLERLGVEPD